jgi:hypothetical protein
MRRRDAYCKGEFASIRRLIDAGSSTQSLVSLAASFAHMHINRLMSRPTTQAEHWIFSELAAGFGRVAASEVPDGKLER